MGRPLYSNKIGETQFYLGNLSLIGMLVFYVLNTYSPSPTYRMLTMSLGAVQAFALFLFFYNMMMTLLTKPAQQ
jgi:hypothetical protein